MTTVDAKNFKLSNTLTGKKEPFTPIKDGHIGIYACGVTVYDHCHIGHAMQAIFFDVIRRYFTFAGFDVTYVRNYTDVDDKIINRAKESGMRPDELAQSMIRSSEEDMASIGVRPATFEPKVSESIDDIIDMIQKLIETGAAYSTSDGDVYYRVRSKKDYGKLSNRDPAELRSNTRELVEGQKEDALDFALWKSDDTDGASWPSPWGQGRPGWHIECSAMSKKYLGDRFDIHGGGRDLVFPHHENEIAQSESANGCPYANYWMHSGLLTIDKQKMSKSLGNHISIKEFVKNWPGEVLRLAYLNQHYSSNVDFTQAFFQTCAKRLLFFYETIAALRGIADATPAPFCPGHEPGAILAEFHENMKNDFATPKALSEILRHVKKASELLRAKNQPSRNFTAHEYLSVLESVFEVFGILEKDPNSFIAELKGKMLPNLGITQAEITELIHHRKAAREAKDFAKSDAIRDQLSSKGIVLMDKPEGTDWTLSFTE